MNSGMWIVFAVGLYGALWFALWWGEGGER